MLKYKRDSLSKDQLYVILNKGTEYPFTGQYNDLEAIGTYLCRLCGFPLYESDSKFSSSCGWPSFDAEILNHVKKDVDADGRRVEILCNRCDAHLGHVFEGEGYTALNTRHCVNSASLDFVEKTNVKDSEEGIFAAGCFWGVEYYFKKLKGVLKVESGYIGGKLESPTYDEICRGDTGHLEAVRVIFDNSVITYKDVAKYFFEIHDPTQPNGQGPDIGDQYLSGAFYYNDSQKSDLLDLISVLKGKGLNVATELLPVSTFWRAEDYHQDYYQRNKKLPYCHSYTKRF